MPKLIRVNDEVIYELRRWQVVSVDRQNRIRLFHHASGDAVWADARMMVWAGHVKRDIHGRKIP